MEFEITPEPSPEDTAAIVAALLKLHADHADTPGPWWKEGLREAIDGEAGAEEI